MEISKEKLQILVDYFFKTAMYCDELNIYEREQADDDLSNMKEWVEDTFGRDLEEIS